MGSECKNCVSFVLCTSELFCTTLLHYYLRVSFSGTIKVVAKWDGCVYRLLLKQTEKTTANCFILYSVHSSIQDTYIGFIFLTNILNFLRHLEHYLTLMRLKMTVFCRFCTRVKILLKSPHYHSFKGGSMFVLFRFHFYADSDYNFFE